MKKMAVCDACGAVIQWDEIFEWIHLDGGEVCNPGHPLFIRTCAVPRLESLAA